MTSHAPFLNPATIANAYRRVSVTLAAAGRDLETLPPAPVASRGVLIVDEDPALGAGLVRLLRAEGFDATWCAPNEDLLASVFAARPDVILLRVPRHDDRSLAACRQLRQLDAARARAVIAYGTGDDDEGAERALASGADDYVADVGRARELRARIAGQMRHLRDREVMRWARAQRSSLRDLAYTDPLTGLANRRGVARALERALGARGPVALALVDLDHFKRMNDTYGHPAGDAVLRRVSRALSAAGPLDATAGRWGGEEFALVFPREGAGSAARLGERVRRAVAEIVLCEIDGAPQVTASVGVAAWNGHGAAPSSSTLISAADRALYASKRAGRNCVNTAVVCDGDDDRPRDSQ